MTSFISTITNIRETSSRNEKEHHLLSLSEDGKRLVKEALDPYRVFGIKKLPTLSPTPPRSMKSLREFFTLLDNLHSRTITGNEAMRNVKETLEKYPHETRSFLMDVLRKDLDAGIGAKSVNKVFPGLIPTFGCQLASKYSEKHIQYPVLVENKYDGLRAIARVDGEEVTIHSRNGKLIPNVLDRFKGDLILLAKRFGEDSITFDGEIVGNSFNGTMSSLGKGRDNSSLDYIIFDVPSLGEMSQEKRTSLLKLNILPSSISRSMSYKAYDFCGMNALYQKALTDGYEGIIIKSPTSSYKNSRSRNWMKLKPTNTYEGLVTQLIQGEGKYQNSLGSLYIEGGGWESHCGSGLSDQERQYIWDNPDEFINRMVEVKAQEKTKSLNNSIPSLRFPVFVRWRDDK